MDKKKSPMGAGPAETPSLTPGLGGSPHSERKAALLAEVGEIEKLLGGAMERDGFGSGLNVRLMPGITYRAVQRLTALLRKIIE
jgi:hypothetical protein